MTRKALRESAEAATKKGNPIPRRRFTGGVFEDTSKAAKRVDHDATKLAGRIGGTPRAIFRKDPVRQEFDVVSPRFVAQAKPANFRLGKKFRSQAKNTFDAAAASGRRPYFHFDGPPGPGVVEKVLEYEKRYVSSQSSIPDHCRRESDVFD